MGSAWRIEWGQWAVGFRTYRVYEDGGRWLQLFIGPLLFTREFFIPARPDQEPRT